MRERRVPLWAFTRVSMIAALLAAADVPSAAMASIAPAAAPQKSAEPKIPEGGGEADAAPSPEAIARARAKADRLIAEGDAEAYFVNITDGAEPRVRHRRSGMECRFSLDDPARIVIHATEGLPPGDDVSCDFTTPLADGAKVAVVMRAWRSRQIDSLDHLLADQVDQARAKMPDLAPAPGGFISFNLAMKAGSDAPTHRAARLRAMVDGQLVFVRSAVGVTEGWVVSQAVRAPADHARPADTLSEVLLGVAMTDVFYAAPGHKAP